MRREILSDQALKLLIGLLLAGHVACALLHVYARSGSAHLVTAGGID